VSGYEPEQNLLVWSQDTYDAWVHRFGSPREALGRIAKDPASVVAPLLEDLGPVPGKRIANLMGSNGIKAAALALLGADVTVIDYGASNARYAMELAAAGSIPLHYTVSEITRAPERKAGPRFDIVFSELGIVHYFTDLRPLMAVVVDLLAVGGRYVLRDFHPVSTKLISFRGPTAKVRKYKVTGDYFDTSLEEQDSPISKYRRPGGTAPAKVLWRKWTLGEVVTAVAASGLRIRALREEPNLSSEVYDRGIPKTYTLVADKDIATAGAR